MLDNRLASKRDECRAFYDTNPQTLEIAHKVTHVGFRGCFGALVKCSQNQNTTTTESTPVWIVTRLCFIAGDNHFSEENEP